MRARTIYGIYDEGERNFSFYRRKPTGFVSRCGMPGCCMDVSGGGREIGSSCLTETEDAVGRLPRKGVFKIVISRA